MLSYQATNSGRLHTLSSDTTRKRKKPAQNPSEHDEFKPNSVDLKSVTKTAFDYTK